jgi:hypothetical protein
LSTPINPCFDAFFFQKQPFLARNSYGQSRSGYDRLAAIGNDDLQQVLQIAALVPALKNLRARRSKLGRKADSHILLIALKGRNHVLSRAVTGSRSCRTPPFPERWHISGRAGFKSHFTLLAAVRGTRSQFAVPPTYRACDRTRTARIAGTQ